MNIFERAARGQYRYKSKKGSLTTEQLFTLKLEGLNDVYQQLRATAPSTEDSLLDSNDTTSKETLVYETKVAVVKFIAEDKKKRALAAQTAAETRAKKQRIMELIDRKQDEALASRSVEELQDLIDKL